MKKLFVISMVLGGCFFLTTTASAVITGSAHDFSAKGWNATPLVDSAGNAMSGSEICITCHTPHNAPGTADGPLWNHEVSAVAAYTLYSSPTFNADNTQATYGQPSGVSKLCLACHDGTVALDSFGGMTGTNFIGGGALVGTDLSDDHPISFTYDTALVAADGELNAVTAPSGITGGTTIDADMLYGGQMECSSCHDVHNSEGQPFLLLKDNGGSLLCLTCHAK